MIDFDIIDFVPGFLMADQNGKALARAIEEGLNAYLELVQEGLDNWNDPSTMPEWRLDELAWEYNAPYDYNAPIAQKRQRIANVYALSRMYGTKKGVESMMAGVFDGAVVQERWQYSGQPFHFRMNFDGSWTPEGLAWAVKAIETVKNVRSTLDSFQFHVRPTRKLNRGSVLYTAEHGEFDVAAQTIPGNWYTDENNNMLMDENSVLLSTE